jgi:competence protein ComEC
MKYILWTGLLVSLFVVRLTMYNKNHISHIPENWFNRSISITGIIIDDPDRGIESTKITLGDLQILVNLPTGISVDYGDQVTIHGIINQPESFMSDTNREFNYPHYLSVHDIYGIMKGDDVIVLKQHQGNGFIEKIFLIKKYFVKTIKHILPMPQAGLFAGIIIGEKSLLTKDIQHDFQIAGLSHMVVLSGYNITIVAIFVITSIAWIGLGYRVRRIGAIVSIPIFLVMTGMGSSSVRAGIMSMLIFILQLTTRPAHVFRIILYTVLVMVYINPRILLYDPSFHMSFLAFIGLIYVTPIIKNFSLGIPEVFGLKDLLLETFSVQLFVMPYILWMSGRFSIFLLIANIITVPLVPLIMGFGFAAALLGMVIYQVGLVIMGPVSIGLSYIIGIAHYVASLSFGIVIVPPFSVHLMFLAYAIIIIVLIYYHLPIHSN